MAPKLPPVLTVSGIRGRDGVTAPHLIADDQCKEAVNVEFFEGGICRKCNGTAAHGTTSLDSGVIYGLFRHVPGNDQAAAEMWAFHESAVIKRLAAGTTWSTITPSPGDTFSYGQNSVSAVTFNGKLFVAANSNVNRLHVWDGTNLRRVGLAPPAGASDAQSAGAITDTRKYKAAVVVKVNSVVVLRSELSPASNAASLSAERATLTLVTAPSEGETHWEAYAASISDNYATYRFIGDAAIGSTIEDNTNDMTAYSTAPTSAEGEFAPLAGRNQLPPSCKFLVTDGNRLLMAGAHETSASTAQTTPKNNRVWFTPALGTTADAYYDDERVSNTTAFKSWVDVGENDGDTITGMGVVEGIVYVFKNERTYLLIPTSDPTVPYIAKEVSKAIGAVTHQSIFPAEDAEGRTVLCFWSRRGPYMIRNSVLYDMGHDIEDVAPITPSTQTPTWGLFYPQKRQAWWRMLGQDGVQYIACCDLRMHFEKRGGWALRLLPGTASLSDAHAGVLFSNTLGASMSLDLKPWLGGSRPDGGSGVTSGLVKADSGTSALQGYIISKTFSPTQFRETFTTRPPTLIAEVSSGVSIQGILRADFHDGTDMSDTVTLTANTGLAVGASGAAGTESRIVKRFDALGMSGMRAVAFQVGDDSAVSSAWTLDSLTVPYEVAL